MGYNEGRGGYVRNFNACPKIKIEKYKAIVIRIIISEKSKLVSVRHLKFMPGLLLLV